MNVKFMDALRSLIFNFCYIFGSLFWSIVLYWATFLPPWRCAAIIGDVYGGYIRFVSRYVMGLKLEIEGLEHVPADGAYILAAKHQSAYETISLPFSKRLRYPVIILKESLTRIPFWGRYFVPMGCIPIDRGAGAAALRKMAEGCRKSMAAGRPVIIFPQGTRVAPGKKAPYKPGLAKLYKDLGVPVVPMALNTGVFWARNAFFKKPGTIVYKFLPPIPAGLPPLKMIEQLEAVIEEESDKLVQRAGGPALEKA